MRKLNRQDWLALAAPAIVILLIAYFAVRQKGWAVGAMEAALFSAGALWLWRRQIIKHPNDTWKARL